MRQALAVSVAVVASASLWACSAEKSGVVAVTDAGRVDTAADPADQGSGAGDLSGEPLDGVVQPERPCATSKTCQIEWPTTPYCDKKAGVCVQCLAEFHCGDGQVCVDHACQPVSCVPGSSSCDGPSLATCNATGDGIALENCPTATPFCVTGKCLPCEPGKPFCAPIAAGQFQSHAVMQCAADGSAAELAQDCAKLEQKCSLGKDFKPHCQACTPGDLVCDGQKAMVCADDGTAFVVAKDCDDVDAQCLNGLCVDACSNNSRLGGNLCRVWAVDLASDATDDAFAVAVANSNDKPAVLTVNAGTGQKAQFTVAPNTVLSLALPLPVWKIPPLPQTKTGVNNHVFALEFSRPLSVTQFKPLQVPAQFSGAATALLTDSQQENDYVVVSRPQTAPGMAGFVSVVAVRAGHTNVTIVPTAATGPLPMVGTGLPVGVSSTVKLEQGQVLTLLTTQVGGDLTGTSITADQRIAVFSGNTSGFVPTTEQCKNGTCANAAWPCSTNADCPVVCCGDHLEAQLWPTANWAKSYAAAHFQPRGDAKDVWRVVALQSGTQVTTTPAVAAIPVLGAGQWFEFESSQDFVIAANHPIEVVQFMAGKMAPDANNDTCTATFAGQKVCQYNNDVLTVPIACAKNSDCPNIAQDGDAGVGDPEMVAVPPQTFWPTHALFVAPVAYDSHYLTITRKDSAVVQLDGKVVPNVQFSALGSHSIARVPLSAGSHTVDCAEPVGLLVHGWSTQTSYAFAVIKP